MKSPFRKGHNTNILKNTKCGKMNRYGVHENLLLRFVACAALALLLSAAIVAIESHLSGSYELRITSYKFFVITRNS